MIVDWKSKGLKYGGVLGPNGEDFLEAPSKKKMKNLRNIGSHSKPPLIY